MQKSKELTFIEALKEMEQGKKLSDGIYKFCLIDGLLNYKYNASDKWDRSVNTINDYLGRTYTLHTEVEKPKKIVRYYMDITFFRNNSTGKQGSRLVFATKDNNYYNLPSGYSLTRKEIRLEAETNRLYIECEEVGSDR